MEVIMYVLGCALAVGAVLGSTPPPTAVNHSWQTFASAVNKGRAVTVTLMDMTRAEGKLLAVDDRTLTIEREHAHRTIESADVYAVRYAGGRSRRAKYGALIGAAVGAIGGALATPRRDRPPYPAEGAVMGAVLFGLPGGAIVGASFPTGPALYQAERATPDPARR